MTASTLPAPEAAAETTGGGACRHCGAPLGDRPLFARIAGREVRVCGDDCLTAVETIADAGLSAWYRLRAHRDASGSVTGDPGFRAEIDAWRLPEVAAGCVRPGRGGADEITLTVEGMRCAGCAWLVEGLLGKAHGVRAASVDFPLRRAVVRFDPRVTGVHRLLEALARAGYRASPYSPHGEEAAIESERRARIRGLGISAAFGMQVMLLSIALYASEHYGGMDPGLEQLFRWLAMVLTVPVLAWPGRAFFTGALAALRGRRLTMDVPVALGLSIAFLGSAFATVSGDGEIWFDSVVMFVALLGGARYLELVARRQSTATVRALARAAPLVATRVRRAAGADDDAGEDAGGEAIDERVPAAALRTGDRVRVRPGETVPADGVIRSGDSAFDESLLTGESEPVARSAGAKALAGSVNGAGVVEVEVTAAGDETVLGGVLRRAEQAARERPAVALLADRVAAWFIGGVLVLATAVAAAWLLHDPARTVAVVVSVLVVTCPCALSLATPAAMTAALGALARAGLVVTRANAVERLALATHCLADKTGTLTEGRYRLRTTTKLGSVPKRRCLAIAAALERYAAHPAAAAIAAAAAGMETGGDDDAPGDGRAPDGAGAGAGRAGARRAPFGRRHGEVVVDGAVADIGGVTGRIDGARYAIGSSGFVAGALRHSRDRPDGGMLGDGTVAAAARGDAPAAGAPPTAAAARPAGAPEAPGGDASGDASRATAEGEGTRVLLAAEGGLLASFVLADSLRPGAKGLVDGLRARGIETIIASGDSVSPVERTGEALGVARCLAGLAPADKLDEADRLAARGERVLMLGDGVNDAPALAGAHVSVAMGRGAAAAASRADAVLLGEEPRVLLAGIDIARRARRVVKQNLAWALAYNLVALPLAATGAVPPWAAAIGMSLSSLAVAGNALRLAPRKPAGHGPPPRPARSR